MIDESELNELRMADYYDRVYRSQLFNHSDCSDPDHPGCENCQEEE
jgi:hypothetical protein